MRANAVSTAAQLATLLVVADSTPHDEDSAPEADRYEQIAIIGDPADANLLAAELRSAGIAVRLHGEAFGPLPVRVGGLAEVEVWVDADRVDDARRIAETWTQ